MIKSKYSLFLITLLLLASVVAGNAASQDNLTSGTKTIVDSGGVSVQVPENIQKVAILCQGGAVQDVILMGGADKIVTMPPNTIPLITKMFPSLKNLPNGGSFDNANVETILSVEPDVVINGRNTKQNPSLIEKGIPTIGLLTGSAQMDTILPEFKMMGNLFNNPSKAEEIIQYWNETIQLVDDRVKTIPASERKHVYYMLGSPLHTNGKDAWGHSFVTTAGGINVADEIGKEKDINAESLIKWDPDVIIVSTNEGKYVSDADIKNNPQLSNLKAVTSGSVYHVPIGGFWWDRPSPEAPLGFLWLAKTLYPDKFADIDMKSEMKKFFTRFYGYDLSDSEIGKILKAEDPATN